MSVTTCHDCLCKEGELHQPGCDMERCPFCGGQLISCDCANRHFYPNYDDAEEFCNLPEKVYKEGLSEEQMAEWEQILIAKGLIPYIQYPNVCAKCGDLYPDLFMVPNAEWEKYVQKDMRRKILCRPCYDHIKKLIDDAEVARQCQT